MYDFMIYVLDTIKEEKVGLPVILTLDLIVALAIVAFFIYKKKIKPSLKSYVESQEREQARKEEFERHAKEIGELKQGYSDFHQAIGDLDDKLNRLSDMVEELKERTNAQERTRLKGSISRLYRECHQNKQWTQMQKDVMEDMIQSYEECGGGNSFVHEIVQKEIYSWKIIDE